MRQRSKSGLFLIEMIIVILFFALTSTTCIQTFVKAHQISQQADDLNQAVFHLQSMSEYLLSDDHTLAKLTSEYEFPLSLDQDWNICSASQAVYQLTLDAPSSADTDASAADSSDTDSSAALDRETAAIDPGNVNQVTLAVYYADTPAADAIYSLTVNLYQPQGKGGTAQ